MNDKQIKQISKFLSFVLRHQPETIGILLDQNGWTPIDDLLEKANHYGVKFDREILNHVVATNAKQRFAFNETLDKIRASQGHSVAIQLGYANQKPPELLFHGTGEKSVQSIWDKGIEKGNRQHVHLSPDFQTAIQVGQRHGKPFVFQVLSEEMYHDQFEFYQADNGVWLTDHVPAQYLKANDV